MARAPSRAPNVDLDGLDGLVRSWERSLRARNLAPKSISTYLETTNQYLAFLRAHGSESDGLVRAQIEEFIAELIATRSAATASVRYRALQQWFKWLVDEEELDRSPMQSMKPPIVPEAPVPIVDEEQMRRVLSSCAGRDFVSRRDTAIILLFYDTGMRLAELASLTLDDIDDEHEVVIVTGKGRRPRACPYGHTAGVALDRYLRVRSRHARASERSLWLGEKSKGPMTDNGIGQLIRRRGRAAGIEGLHPHQLRHTFAHQWMASGGAENDLLQLAGWRSRQMLGRYGASAANERAREAHRRNSPADRL